MYDSASNTRAWALRSPPPSDIEGAGASRNDSRSTVRAKAARAAANAATLCTVGCRLSIADSLRLPGSRRVHRLRPLRIRVDPRGRRRDVRERRQERLVVAI